MPAENPRVETGSQPAPFMAAIASKTNTPTDGLFNPADFTFTATGALDTLFSNTVDLPEYRLYRGLLFTVAGDIKIQDWNGNIVGPFTVPAGVLYGIRPRRIYATSTVTGVYPLYGNII